MRPGDGSIFSAGDCPFFAAGQALVYQDVVTAREKGTVPFWCAEGDSPGFRASHTRWPRLLAKSRDCPRASLTGC